MVGSKGNEVLLPVTFLPKSQMYARYAACKVSIWGQWSGARSFLHWVHTVTSDLASCCPFKKNCEAERFHPFNSGQIWLVCHLYVFQNLLETRTLDLGNIPLSQNIPNPGIGKQDHPLVLFPALLIPASLWHSRKLGSCVAFLTKWKHRCAFVWGAPTARHACVRKKETGSSEGEGGGFSDAAVPSLMLPHMLVRQEEKPS